MVRLLRGATEIGTGTAVGSRIGATLANFYNGDYNSVLVNNSHFLDSPATTSATTYKAQFRLGGGGAGTAYINQSPNDVDAAYTARGISVITVMEISG
jgi:hypothetical protein